VKPMSSITPGDRLVFNGSSKGVVTHCITGKDGRMHYICRNDKTGGTHFVKAGTARKLKK